MLCLHASSFWSRGPGAVGPEPWAQSRGPALQPLLVFWGRRPGPGGSRGGVRWELRGPEEELLCPEQNRRSCAGEGGQQLLQGSRPPSAPSLRLQAQALLRWHQTSNFCATTGQLTGRNQAGSQRVSGSGSVSYPQVGLDAPAQGGAGAGRLRAPPPASRCLRRCWSWCLMADAACWPGSRPSLRACTARWPASASRVSLGPQDPPPPLPPAGPLLTQDCLPGESLEEAASREVAEEVGLEVHSVSYSCSQHWPWPHSSLMLGCHALVSPAHTQVGVGTGEPRPQAGGCGGECGRSPVSCVPSPPAARGPGRAGRRPLVQPP